MADATNTTNPSGLIERVARAMAGRVWDAIRDEHSYDEEGPSRSDYRKMARTAIEAMRVPTDAMVEALDNMPWATHEGTLETGPQPVDHTRRAWAEMIDAALSEKPHD